MILEDSSNIKVYLHLETNTLFPFFSEPCTTNHSLHSRQQFTFPCGVRGGREGTLYSEHGVLHACVTRVELSLRQKVSFP